MKIKKKIVVFASGSGSSFENICKRFSKDTFVEISKLYCNNNKAFVAERAQKQGIKSLIFQNEDLTNKRILMDLRKVNPDLIVLAGFLKKFPNDIINEFKHRIINIHPSLLPKYGGKGMYGANVHKAVVAAGEKESGITIHEVTSEYDKGTILFQAKTQLEPNETADSLVAKIHELEYEHFPRVIAEILEKQ